MNILICGGRHFNNYNILEFVVDSILQDKKLDYSDIDKIISGHCEGADILGELYAKSHDIDCKIYLVKWEKYGKAAGPIRNKEMIDGLNTAEDIVIAFASDHSVGTKSTIKLAEKKGLETYIIEYSLDNPCFELFEGISRDIGNPDNFIIDWTKNNSSDIIKLNSECIKITKFNKNLRYFGYRINKDASYEDRRDFLQSIKADIQNKFQFIELVDRCVEDFYLKSDVKNYDYILKLPSKSKINDLMCDRICKFFDNCEELLLSKKPILDLDIDWDKLKLSFKGNYYDTFETYLKNLIKTLKQDKDFSISKISPKYRRYLKPMININGELLNLNGNILLVDDTFTTGSTITMVLNALNNLGFTGNISILTLINNN